jgi:beta-lactamase regulating signal transducer with metallopeptidase domain/peroxiredoxin
MQTLTTAHFLTLLGRDSLQGGVLVLAVLLVQRLLGQRLSPRWRSRLWLLVIARLLLVVSIGSVASVFNLLPPAATVRAVPTALPATQTSLSQRSPETIPAAASQWPAAITPPTPSAGPATASPLRRSSPAETVQPTPSEPAPLKSIPVDWTRILFLTWLAGAGGIAAFVLIGSLRADHRFRRLTPVTDPRLTSLLADCEARMGMSRRLPVVQAPGIATPALHGLIRSRLLLPAGLAAQFSDQQLRFILLHELAHVKRRDILLNWLAAMFQAIHWFNPVIWFGFTYWRADRELACDALAIEAAGGNESRAYGETILRLLETFTHRAALPGMVGILEDKTQLRDRLKMIAGFRASRKLGFLTAAALAVLCLICLTDAQKKTLGAPGNPEPKAAQPSRPVVADGPSMKLTVLDGATGAPLEGAEVFAPNQSAFFGARENAPRWVTDKFGSAVIHLGQCQPDQRMTWFTLSVRRHGYGPVGMSWAAETNDVRPDLPKETTVRLKPGRTIGGLVVDEQGVPQPAIRVRVFGNGYSYGGWRQPHQEYPEFWNDSVESEPVVTDSAGRWQANDFPTDFEKIAIEFVRPDGSIEKFRNPPVTENPNEPQGDPMDFPALLAGQAKFILKSGHQLPGVTVDSQGHPLASVHIKTGYGTVNIKRTGEFTSDDSGHFTLRHLNHRQIILTATAPGYAITSQIVDLQSNLAEIRLQMDPLAPLRIVVLDNGGKPIAGARVATAGYKTEAQLLDFSGVTDDHGVLVWTNAPGSSFDLAAVLPGSGMRQRIGVARNQHAVTFHLRAGMDHEIIVTGRARDAKTGAPIKLASVAFQTADREGFPWAAETSDASFRLTIPATRFRPGGFYPSYQLQLKAPGYRTLTTPLRDFDEGDWDAEFEMPTADASQGIARLPDGRPAAEATLWVRTGENDGWLYLYGMDQSSSVHMVKEQADADGKFQVPEIPDDQPLVFTAPEGFLATTMAEVKQHPEVRLQSWGRVAGVLKVAGQSKGGATVSLTTLHWSPDTGFQLSYSTTTAPDGSFAFEKVPAGEYKIYRQIKMRIGRAITEDHQMPVTVTSGKTTTVAYSNPGRAVIGQAVPNKPDLTVDWLNDDNTLTLVQPTPETGQDAIKLEDFATVAAFTEARKSSINSPAVIARERNARTFVLAFEEDGSFRADDVPPGKYELKIRLTKPDKSKQFSPFSDPQNDLGSLSREVVVPPGDGSFDLGTLTIAMKGGATVAATTPPVKFTATLLDGKTVNLQQYQGRYVVLAFWSLWSDRSTDEMKGLQKLQATLGKNSRIAFLGVNLGDDPAAVAQAVAARGYAWSQATVSTTNLANVAAGFNVSSLPAIYLIDPNGRIVSRDLMGDRLVANVERALGSK